MFFCWDSRHISPHQRHKVAVYLSVPMPSSKSIVWIYMIHPITSIAKIQLEPCSIMRIFIWAYMNMLALKCFLVAEARRDIYAPHQSGYNPRWFILPESRDPLIGHYPSSQTVSVCSADLVKFLNIIDTVILVPREPDVLSGSNGNHSHAEF